LVIVALAMTGLLAFAALVVDVGHVLAEKRHMQNAADAGALAGARELCMGNTSNIITRAQQYAVTENGAATAAVLRVGDQVTVTASSTVNTVFARLFGVPTVAVSAEATAACRIASSVCNLWPLVASKDEYDAIPDGSLMYIWDDENAGLATSDVCSKCECGGVAFGGPKVGPGHRGWVRFSPPTTGCTSACGSNCGASALGCWLINDWPGSLAIGQCVPGNPGVKNSALDDAASRIGQLIKIPLYSTGTCTAANKVGSCPGDLYYIGGFGCFEVVEVRTNLTLAPKAGYTKKDCPTKARVITARKTSGCMSECDTCGGTTLPIDGSGSVGLVN
jgi:hypothetical protein